MNMARAPGADCRRVVVLLLTQLRFLVADPFCATSPHAFIVWLGCPNLRVIRCLNLPST